MAALLQDVLVDFVVTLMRTAAEESSKRGKLSVEDLIFLVRKVSAREQLTASAVHALLLSSVKLLSE